MMGLEQWVGRRTGAVYVYQLAASVALLAYAVVLTWSPEPSFFTPQAYYLYPGPGAARTVAALAALLGLLNGIPLGVGTRRQIRLVFRTVLLIAQLMASVLAGAAIVTLGVLAFAGTIRAGAAPLLSSGYLAFGLGYIVVALSRPFTDPFLLRFYRVVAPRSEVDSQALARRE